MTWKLVISLPMSQKGVAMGHCTLSCSDTSAAVDVTQVALHLIVDHTFESLEDKTRLREHDNNCSTDSQFNNS